MTVLRTFVVVALLILTATAAGAQEKEAESEGFHRFHAAVLIGDTHAGDMNGTTFGGDLEVRLARPVGIGVTGEHVNEPFRENVWVFPVIVHPTPRLKLSVGPGLERARHEDPAHHAHVEQHGLLRVGAAYDIPLRHGWTLDPDVAVDFVAGDRLLVYALAIGREF